MNDGPLGSKCRRAFLFRGVSPAEEKHDPIDAAAAQMKEAQERQAIPAVAGNLVGHVLSPVIDRF